MVVLAGVRLSQGANASRYSDDRNGTPDDPLPARILYLKSDANSSLPLHIGVKMEEANNILFCRHRAFIEQQPMKVPANP